MPDTINQLIHPPLVSPAEADLEDVSVPLPRGLREIRLSNQAAAAIEQLLDDASYPTYSGREMPTADASVLLEKIR